MRACWVWHGDKTFFLFIATKGEGLRFLPGAGGGWMLCGESGGTEGRWGHGSQAPQPR